MSKVCSVCGTTNPEDALFCEGCGVELTDATTTPAQEGMQGETPAAPISKDTPAEDAQSTEPAADSPAPSSAEPPASDDGASVGTSPTQESSAEVAEAAPASPPSEAPTGETPAAPETSTDSGTSADAETTDDAEVPVAPAKLFAKRHGAPSGDPVPLFGGRLVVGRFDPSSGPVDIDAAEFGGAEHISRHHAELFTESGVWKVRDLGSTNGVFLKRAGEEGYGPRLQEPAELHDGDEVAFGNVVFVFRQDEA